MTQTTTQTKAQGLPKCGAGASLGMDQPSQWGLEHHIINRVHPFRRVSRKPVPVFSKAAPIPVLSQWSCHRFILLYSLWPTLVQACWLRLTGTSYVPWWACLGLYTIAYFNMMLREATKLHRIGRRCVGRLLFHAHITSELTLCRVGFLDGDKHPRDQIPEDGARKVLTTVTFFAIMRPFLTYILAGWSEVTRYPVLKIWLPLELFLYSIVLDLWFYTYHRCCHEVDFLWKFHRTHHLTKHPIPLLASFSDLEEEVTEVIIVPTLTYLTLKYCLCLPMNFHEWWICQAYILFEEVMGHSGLRMYAITPSLASVVLQWFGCEFVIEDHDLHHRNGWRKSFNYGKQTRLWDCVFGTLGPRLESKNVDEGTKIKLPVL